MCVKGTGSPDSLASQRQSTMSSNLKMAQGTVRNELKKDLILDQNAT